MVWLGPLGFCGFERKCCPHTRGLLCLWLPSVRSVLLHVGQTEAWGCPGPLGARGVQGGVRTSCGGRAQATFFWLYWKSWYHANSLQESFRWSQCQWAKPSTPLILRLKYTKYPTFSAVDTPGTAHRQPGRCREVPESSHDFFSQEGKQLSPHLLSF